MREANTRLRPLLNTGLCMAKYFATVELSVPKIWWDKWNSSGLVRWDKQHRWELLLPWNSAAHLTSGNLVFMLFLYLDINHYTDSSINNKQLYNSMGWHSLLLYDHLLGTCRVERSKFSIMRLGWPVVYLANAHNNAVTELHVTFWNFLVIVTTYRW